VAKDPGESEFGISGFPHTRELSHQKSRNLDEIGIVRWRDAWQ